MMTTPSGTRDLLSSQVRAKRRLQNRIMNRFDRYGYEEVMTPAIEYYQTYNRAFASLEDRQMYKFFDENGEILTLRMDMTVPIARLAASALREAPLPLRLSYCSNVYKVHKTFAGKRTEVTDCGVELIGAGADGDLEIVCLALDVMNSLDLPLWTLELSDCRLFLKAAGLVFESDEDISCLGYLIDAKSMVELEAFLDRFDLPDAVRAFFLELPLLSGGLETLERVRDLCFDPALLEVADSLEQLWKDLDRISSAEQISFDFGKLPHLNYYTGLIFEGFAAGAARSVLSGGRYDHLMERFGRTADAVGFSLKVDSLFEAVGQSERPSIVCVCYPESRKLEAFALAENLRKDHPVRLQRQSGLEEIVVKSEERP